MATQAPVEVKLSELYPSGVRLRDLEDDIHQSLGRLTAAITEIQKQLDATLEAFTLLTSFREFRWACVIFVHGFEDIFDVASEIADQASSLPPSALDSLVKSTFDSLSHKAGIIMTVLGRQETRTDELTGFWTRDLSPELLHRKPAPAPPAPKKVGILTRIWRLLPWVSKRPPSSQEQLIVRQDLSPLMEDVKRELASLTEQQKVLKEYWESWGAGPRELWGRRKTPTHEPDWLTKEWDVHSGLKRLAWDVHGYYERIRTVKPEFEYPISCPLLKHGRGQRGGTGSEL